MVFNDLSVRVAADTSSFTTGINRAQNSLGDMRSTAGTTSAALQVLQGRADEAGDEISGVGRDANRTSTQLGILGGAAGSAGGAFASLSASTSGLSFSFGSLTTSLTGTVGLLGAVTAAATGLVSTLLPLAAVVGTLTAGLGALAGAFGAVIGTGILAFGQQRGEQNRQRLEEIQARISYLENLQEAGTELSETEQEELETLREQSDELEEQTGIMGGLQDAMGELLDELQPIITEFGEQFIPLIEDAIDAIPRLVRNIFDATGGMGEFVRVLRELGNQAFRAIPRIAAGIFDLARTALPIFMDFIGFISQNGQSAFQGMLRVTRELATPLMNLGRALVDALPELTALGTVILQTLIPAFEDYIRLVEDIIQIGAGSDGLVDFLRNLVNNALEWFNNQGQSLLSNLTSGIVDSLATLLSPGDDEDQTLRSAFLDRIGNMLRGINSWLEGDGKSIITNVYTNLFDTIANILNENSDTFEENIFDPLMDIYTNLFDATTEALASEEGNRLTESISRAVQNSLLFLAQELVTFVQSDEFAEVMGQFGDALVNVLSGLFRNSIMQGIIRASPAALVASRLGRALNIDASQVTERLGLQQLNPVSNNPQQAVQQAQQQNQQNLNLQIELIEDTEYFNAQVEAGATEVVRNQNRRSGRISGRDTRITR